MDCNIIKDLIPLCIDGCCSEESRKIVEEHMASCAECRKLFEDMKSPSAMVTVTEPPQSFSKLNDWKASVMQSILLFLSFGLITIGVALEARTPSGALNGFWASNLVIPATGFMLSLANWYFIRVYRSRKDFSNGSLMATLGVTLCAYVWAGIHYETNPFNVFVGKDFAEISKAWCALLSLNGIGIVLTIVFCALSKLLASQYAKMLGKE